METSFSQNLETLYERRKKLDDQMTGIQHETLRLEKELEELDISWNSIWAEMTVLDDLIWEIEDTEK
jgi:chromosome segregation ATPase